jgi:hypothetical protein
MNAITLEKGSERFIFLFDNASRTETLRTFRRFAMNPELDFDWYDAMSLIRLLLEVYVV